MKTIISKVGRVETEFYVVFVDQPIKIDFGQQIEDIIISSPDIDVLIGWDYDKEEEFRADNCLLIKTNDNMKEIGKDRCTHFYVRPKNEKESGTVYITGQR